MPRIAENMASRIEENIVPRIAENMAQYIAGVGNMAFYTNLTEEFKRALVGAGYRQLPTNLSGFSLFYMDGEGQPRGILLAEMGGRTELTKEQFAWIHRRAYEGLAAMGTPPVFLTVAADAGIGMKREFFADIPACWLWELDTGKLLIYENQPAAFYGAEKIIERLGAGQDGAWSRQDGAQGGQAGAWSQQDSGQGGRAGAWERQNGAGRAAWGRQGQSHDGGGGWLCRERLRRLWRTRAVMNTLMVAVNIAVFIVMEFMGDTEDVQFMLEHGASFPILIRYYGESYRLFTSMFLHFGLSHLLNNMLVLFLLGDNLERAVGKWKYLVIYLFSGIGGNLLSLWWELRTGDYAVSAGASGAIFGVVGALFYVVAVNKGRLEDMTTRRLGILIVMTLYLGFTSTGVDNFAHIGGLLTGFAVGAALYRRPRRRNYAA